MDHKKAVIISLHYGQPTIASIAALDLSSFLVALVHITYQEVYPFFKRVF